LTNSEPEIPVALVFVDVLWPFTYDSGSPPISPSAPRGYAASFAAASRPWPPSCICLISAMRVTPASDYAIWSRSHLIMSRLYPVRPADSHRL